jgi:hypothetical protein
MGQVHQPGEAHFQIDSAGRDRLEAVPGVPTVGPTGREGLTNWSR